MALYALLVKDKGSKDFKVRPDGFRTRKQAEQMKRIELRTGAKQVIIRKIS